MIDRDLHVQRITGLLKRFPVVALLGARQVGKTTLAGLIAPSLSDHNTRFDLENPADVARLADPMLALQGLKGIVVLDEVQRRPELFPVLRVLADRKPVRARFWSWAARHRIFSGKAPSHSRGALLPTNCPGSR